MTEKFVFPARPGLVNGYVIDPAIEFEVRDGLLYSTSEEGMHVTTYEEFMEDYRRHRRYFMVYVQRVKTRGKRLNRARVVHMAREYKLRCFVERRFADGA